MTGDVHALIPAKAASRRVPDKNFRPFYKGLSLLEIKILVLQQSGLSEIVVSSDDDRAMLIAERRGAQFQRRRAELCGDQVNLGELFRECLAGMEDELVYWAHPTSPFVSVRSTQMAVAIAAEQPAGCTLGVHLFQEFLWTAAEPLNYDPCNQPRSQDLDPLYRITGGVHIARGALFKAAGAVAFRPHRFVALSVLESFDINTQEEWDIAVLLAPEGLKSL